MSNKKSSGGLGSMFQWLVVVGALVVAWLVFLFLLGNPDNFEGGDPTKHPLPGNFMGLMYKGGFIVPELMALFIIVVAFSIERLITLVAASGKQSIDTFMSTIREQLAGGDIQAASAECDKQQGALANVVKSALGKYTEMENDAELDKEQKVLAIQKEVEEATALELPMLEKNLVFLSTISSVATLVALLGTVIGMIRAFAALSASGAPDSQALSAGISEALINTALGIGTSAIAIIMYNVFTTKIDKVTYSIDEAGFSIVQTFAAKHKK